MPNYDRDQCIRYLSTEGLADLNFCSHSSVPQDVHPKIRGETHHLRRQVTYVDMVNIKRQRDFFKWVGINLLHIHCRISQPGRNRTINSTSVNIIYEKAY